MSATSGRLLALLILMTALPLTTTLAGDLDPILNDVAPDIKKWATLVEVTGPEDRPAFTWHEFRDSESAVDFWPASTIKIYTVVAALEYLESLGAPLESSLTFEHRSDGQLALDCARTMPEMISEVFRRSSNEDYTLLLRFVGIDRINTEFLIPERGFPHSALMRGYVLGRPYEYRRDEGQRVTIVPSGGGTPVAVEHRWSSRSYSEERGATIISATTGNCTSTHELAECLRRILFAEHLPAGERYHLSPGALDFVRHGRDGLHGLEDKLETEYPVGQALAKHFPQATFYRKAGQISTYSLDAAFVDDAKGSGKRFILVVAAASGKLETITAMADRLGLWVRDKK